MLSICMVYAVHIPGSEIREAAHARLAPSKVPQPGVDLVNMAAPPLGWARTIGAAALKSVLPSAAVLMWNS